MLEQEAKKDPLQSVEELIWEPGMSSKNFIST